MNKRNIDTYLQGNIFPRWVIFLIDVCIVGLSFLFTCCVKFDWTHLAIHHSFLVKGMFLIIGVNALFFILFKTYAGVLRFSSFIDLVRIFIAQTFSFSVLFVINILLRTNQGPLFSTGVLPVTYVLTLVLLVSLRIVVKMYFEYRNFEKRDVIRVMVYVGEGREATVAKRLRGDCEARYRIRGFITDSEELIGRRVMAVPVYPNDTILPEIIGEKVIDAVIAEPEKVKIMQSTGLADKLLSQGIKLMSISPVTELHKESAIPFPSVKEIDIEDLLLREPVEIEIEKITSLLQGKRVMITGAAGSIGKEIIKQLVSMDIEMLILVDQAETPMHDVRLMMQDNYRHVTAYTIIADIVNKSRFESIFLTYKPQIVFHAAAYKHIPMLEANVSEAVQANVVGTCNLVDLAWEYNIERFIMISSDKAAYPSNVMGATKRIAEIYIQAVSGKIIANNNHGTCFMIARLGNILGSNGSVLPHFKEQISKGGPLTVTHPAIIRYFMTIPDACRLLLESAYLGKAGEIYVFDMGAPVKILDLAKRMISLSGYIPGRDIKIEFTGLRAGEKLYEEPVNVREGCHSTGHDKIFVVSAPSYNYDKVKKDIEQLIRDSYLPDQLKIVSGIKKIVPEFVSQNSFFERLDKNNN